MNSTKFKSICEMLFGRSWQAQVADYLMISRKTVSSWIERGSIPAWVEEEIRPLIIRRNKEVKFANDALEMSNDDFYHYKAILIGEVHHYDSERYNFADIQQFIENQKWTVLEYAKQLIREKQSLEDILREVEDCMLSENDIADYLERNDTANDEIFDIQNMRGDACSDVKAEVENIFERIKK